MVRPSGPIIGPGALKVIQKAVDLVFDRAKARVLGPWSVSKQIAIDHNHHLSLPGIFEQAAREEGYAPDIRTLKQLMGIAGGYVDSTREQVKARVVKEVTAFLADAHAAGVKTDLRTVLGGKLSEVMDAATVSMRRIIDTEANQAKNVSILDGIGRISAAQGIEDPVVYFVSVNDDSRCAECTRLHTVDGTRPKLWLLSEVGHGYHKRGEDNPKIGGLHPNCRCTMATLMPGYGFDAGGRVIYVARDHNEFTKQRG
jgi:hypothetical protein